MIRVSGVVWFTNLKIKKTEEDLILYKKYSKNEYTKFDNYDAINIDKVKDIPVDYEKPMGVPITFLNKHNPDQFEILGIMASTTVDNINFGYPYVDGKKKFARVVIRNKRL